MLAESCGHCSRSRLWARSKGLPAYLFLQRGRANGRRRPEDERSLVLNGKKRYAFYAHLSEVFVNAGDVIESTSTYIGAVGNTGNAKGIAADKVHLHFEFRTDAYGGSGSEDRIDPELILGSPPYHGLYYFEDEPI